MPKSTPLVLAILDGWGLGKPGPSNAISLAHTPNMVRWMKKYPCSRLAAYGSAVGLSGTTTGNSEVGHLNIGAGYIVPQDEVRISDTINDGSLGANQVVAEIIDKTLEHRRSLHFIVLAGPGQVHSNIEHLWGFLEHANKSGISRVFVHLISDGRDSSPLWLGKNAEAVQRKIEVLGGQVASVCGRYMALDRDKRWERTEKMYRLLVERKGERAADLASAIHRSYDQGFTDEFVPPTVIANGQAIKSDDVVVFLNFRSDRARQLTQAFKSPRFSAFERPIQPNAIHFYTMTQYQAALPVSGIIFNPQLVELPLAKVLSDAGLRQLHAAESEKYAHVTYFLNGGREAPFANEDRQVIPSPKVATYDLRPAMSAMKLTNKVVEAVESRQYDVIILNYANADMVAHTGNLEATIEAVQVVDECLGMLHQAVSGKGGILMITADHGNAEQLKDAEGNTDTEHNSGVVPLLVVGEALPGVLEPEGALANVAPTLLEALGVSTPAQMTAGSLWVKST